MNTFSTILKELRKSSGLTQSELAEKLKITRSTVGMYETGKREPDFNTLNAISDFFKTDINYLLGKENKLSSLTDSLTKKDEKDIAQKLRSTLEQLENSQDGLMFDGEPLSEHDRELLKISLENSMRIGKQISKQKYTPKKYK